MIHEPPLDQLAVKVGSKYSLCIVASKRARQILDNAHNNGLRELPNNEKPLTLASEEIYEGKVSATKY